MAQALAAYAVAALLLAASAGPILAGVRDASLTEFEDLGKPKALDSFPFLKEVRPYLPPVVVEWLIVKKGAPQDLPPGGKWRVDEDGRVVIIWPDGCEETETTYRAGSECDPSRTDCPDDPAAHTEACGPVCPDGTGDAECPPPLECPPGEIAADGGDGAECVPDPACDLDASDPARPEDCPGPPPPPPPTCPDGYVMDYGQQCILLAPALLRSAQFTNNAPGERNLPLELRVPYENLTLDVRWAGVPSPGWILRLFYNDGTEVCWTEDEGDGARLCDLAENNPLGGTDGRSYTDAIDDVVPKGNLTLHIEYLPQTASTGAELQVFLYGKPHDARSG